MAAVIGIPTFVDCEHCPLNNNLHWEPAPHFWNERKCARFVDQVIDVVLRATVNLLNSLGL